MVLLRWVSTENSTEKAMKNNIKSASILVTGANGGIGIETVKLLMEKEAGRIVLACRTQAKADQTKATLTRLGSTQLESAGGFDMTREASIREAVRRLPTGQQFDTVFLQSGGLVVGDRFQFIEANGMQVERSIFQNVLGGYLTLKYLEEFNLIRPGARIVFAGGEGARGIPGMIEKPHFQSVEEFQSYLSIGRGKYNDLNAIGVSKFASALLVQKLASMDLDRQYVWFSPGLTSGTKGLDNIPGPKRIILKYIGFPLMRLLGLAQGPVQAAEKYVACLAGDHGNNGDLIGAPEGKALGKLVDQKPMNPCLTNHLLRDAFWKVVQQTCGPIKAHKILNKLTH